MARRKVRQSRTVRRLTLSEYQELLVGCASPSQEQREAFARFVSRAHSWYKHLPTWPQGVPMKFFLDPGAGAQRIINARGRLQQVDRLEHGFHYSWLPTAEYRERFGHAAYARTAGTGTVVSLAATDGSELIPSDHEPLVWQPGGAELVALPDEVLEAGTTFLSALVHPRAPFILLVRALRDEQLGRPWPADCPTDWPAESGGAAALAQIIERVRALIANPELEEPPPETAPRSTGDFVLYRLLTAERERQRRGMVEALKRVVDLMP